MAIKQWQIDLEVKNHGSKSPYYGQQTGASSIGKKNVGMTPGAAAFHASGGGPRNDYRDAGANLSAAEAARMDAIGRGLSMYSNATQPLSRIGVLGGKGSVFQEPRRELSGGRGSSFVDRIFSPREFSGLTRHDDTIWRLRNETSRAMDSIDAVVGAFPRISRFMNSSMNTLKGQGGVKKEVSSPDRINFKELLRRPGEQFASDLPFNPSAPRINTRKGHDWEIPRDEMWRLSQDFETHGERAIDVRANRGSPIPAPVFGKVVATEKDYPDYHWSYGNMVVIEDTEGRQHLIAHMDGPTNYKVGDTVWPGDVVGAVGRTGRYIDQGGGGYHVHYEVFDPQSGQRFDPTSYAEGYFIPLY